METHSGEGIEKQIPGAGPGRKNRRGSFKGIVGRMGLKDAQKVRERKKGVSEEEGCLILKPGVFSTPTVFKVAEEIRRGRNFKTKNRELKEGE